MVHSRLFFRIRICFLDGVGGGLLTMTAWYMQKIAMFINICTESCRRPGNLKYRPGF